MSEKQYRNIKRGIIMTSKLFYKSILSKIIPILLTLIFLPGVLYAKFVDEMPLNVIVNYIGLTISIILREYFRYHLFRICAIIKCRNNAVNSAILR